jgi:hypothetical protein
MSMRALPKLSEEPELATRPEVQAASKDPPVVQLPVRKRVMLIASGGGHWIEMTRLADAFRCCHCEFVSTAPNLIAPFGDRPVVKVTDGSRDSLRALLGSFRQLWRLIRERRPDLVVSTGAAPGAIAIYIAKLCGIRTIWIDSVANSDALSLSGRAVRPVADLCLTQWPEVASRDPRIRYFGRVL